MKCIWPSMHFKKWAQYVIFMHCLSKYHRHKRSHEVQRGDGVEFPIVPITCTSSLLSVVTLRKDILTGYLIADVMPTITHQKDGLYYGVHLQRGTAYCQSIRCNYIIKRSFLSRKHSLLVHAAPTNAPAFPM